MDCQNAYEIETEWRGNRVTVEVFAQHRPVKSALVLMDCLGTRSVRIWLLRDSVKHQVYEARKSAKAAAQ